jgi:hypothetical protein
VACLSSSDVGPLTRMFLRDCAFLMRLYGRADSRWVWSYAIFGFATTLGAFALFVFFSIAALFPGFIPATFHPATASKEILAIEGVGIFLAVGVWMEHRFRGMRDDVSSLAGRYWTFSDRIKWCLTTLLGLGSIAGVVVMTIAMYR